MTIPAVPLIQGTILAFLWLSASPALAQLPSQYLRRGFVNNHHGDRCWYTQERDPDNTYFFGPQMQIVGIMTFEDPKCMTGTGTDSDINLMMVNNLISRWYGPKDAAFRTRPSEMLKGLKSQKKGKCIQSTKIDFLGISVDYVVVNNSIIRVMHGLAPGCVSK